MQKKSSKCSHLHGDHPSSIRHSCLHRNGSSLMAITFMHVSLLDHSRSEPRVELRSNQASSKVCGSKCPQRGRCSTMVDTTSASPACWEVFTDDAQQLAAGR